MDQERLRQVSEYQPGQWQNEETILPRCSSLLADGFDRHPDARDQSRLLDLLGSINYRILTGNKVYIEVGGVVYKTLYGGYWRSVFTGIPHYLLRCQEITGSLWKEENETGVVDLPIDYSNEGWTARGHSLSFILSRDW